MAAEYMICWGVFLVAIIYAASDYPLTLLLSRWCLLLVIHSTQPYYTDATYILVRLRHSTKYCSEFQPDHVQSTYRTMRHSCTRLEAHAIPISSSSVTLQRTVAPSNKQSKGVCAGMIMVGYDKSQETM
jgi:hypothetical protein